MRESLRVITPPAVEPVTLAEAKAHCRVDSSADDMLIASLIVAARSWAEVSCNRFFVTQTVELTLDAFPCGWIDLPGGNVQSVTSIKYRDEDDAQQTWTASEYITDLASEPARVEPALNYSYPHARARPGTVVVRYVAGYAPAGSPLDAAEGVPQAISQAILLLVGHWYENREAVNIGNITSTLEFTVDALLWPYRILRF